MTRVRTKKTKEELNGLIKHISNSCPVEHTNMPIKNLKIVNALTLFFKLLNLIWSKLEQTNLFKLRIEIKQNLVTASLISERQQKGSLENQTHTITKWATK